MAVTTTLFSFSTMDSLAERIIAGTNIQRGVIDWNRFKDGHTNPFIHDVEEKVEECNVAFLASLNDEGEFFSQSAVMRALIRYGARNFSLVIPYLPMLGDRVVNIGEVATAKSLAVWLSALPRATQGLPKIYTWDIHAEGERSYFYDSVAIFPKTAMGLCKEEILKTFGANAAVAFPDQGAYKRFGRYFPGLKQIICYKERFETSREVKIVEGDPRGMHVVIIDDLGQTGGTLEECRKKLMAAGALSVSVWITHAVFPQEAWKRFTDCSAEDKFANIWTTDSCPETIDAIDGRDPFRIISLDKTIRQIILAEHTRSMQ